MKDDIQNYLPTLMFRETPSVGEMQMFSFLKMRPQKFTKNVVIVFSFCVVADRVDI